MFQTISEKFAQFHTRRFLALILLATPLIFISWSAFARAGGGGGGGSSSRSSSSHSRSSGSRGSLIAELIMYIGLGLSGTHVFLIHRKINKKQKEIRLALKQMQQLEPEWSETDLEQQVRQKFSLLQWAWSKQDLETLKRHLRPNLYARWETEINEQRARNEYNFIDQLQIHKIRFVAVQNYLNNQDDAFTVCIDASCIDIIRKRDTHSIDHDKDSGKDKFRAEHFKEFWSFQRDRGDWKLASVVQFSGWSRFVDSKILYEIKNGKVEEQQTITPHFVGNLQRKNGEKRIITICLTLGVFSVFISTIVFESITVLYPMDAFFRASLYATPICYLLHSFLKKYIMTVLEKIDASLKTFTVVVSSIFGTILVTSLASIFVINDHFDHHAPLVTQTKITHKYTTKNKKKVHYKIVAASPFDESCCFFDKESITFSTTASEYESVQPGKSEAQLTTKGGLLGIHTLIHSQVVMPESKEENTQTRPKGIPARANRKTLQGMLSAKAWKAEPITEKTDKFRKTLWPNGALKSKEPLIDGKIHGVAEYRFLDGQLYGFIPYRHGKKHGQFRLLREDGSRDQDLSYKDGVLHGLCRWYKEDGQLLQEAIYVDGQAVADQ